MAEVAATEAALAGDILAGTSAALAGATSVALVTPGWPAPHSAAIILSAIDLASGTGIGFSIIDLRSGTGIDFSIIGSLETGLPFSAWATLTVTQMAATRAYGRHGDGAGGTSATDNLWRNANHFNDSLGTS